MVASLAATERWSNEDIARLQKPYAECKALPAGLLRAAGDVLMLRLAITLENTLAEVFTKLLCGATYLDGSASGRLVVARSAEHADDLMRTHGRNGKTAKFTRWLLGTSIEENSRLVFPSTEHCLSALSKFSAEIDEIRVIRNHIAHGNAGTAVAYRAVLRKYYGPTARLIPTGVFLMSQGVHPGGMLGAYIVTTKVVTKELFRR